MAEEAAATIERIHARYVSRFAGHPRISRNPEELKELQTQLAAVEGRTEADEARFKELTELYDKEIAAIEEARADGPLAVKAHRALMWTRLLFANYTRHFAGQPRATRDLGRLQEIIEGLRLYRGELATIVGRYGEDRLKKDIEVTEQTLDRYAREIDAIKAARATDTANERGGRLAFVANEQFAVYRAQFAGKSRISRRPAVLERIIGNLESLLSEMQALNSTHESHPKNIEVVSGRLTAYKSEIGQIRQARASNTVADRINALAAAANDVFTRYRENFAGKDRRTRDLALLTGLLDELFPVAQEMDDIDRLEGEENNARNLTLVTDQLRIYNREWEEIRKLQAEQQPAS